MRIDILAARWLVDSDGEWLCFKIPKHKEAVIVCDMVSKKPCVAEVDFKKEKRSLDANAYCWTLINKLAVAVDLPAIDVYKEQIRNVPQKPSRVLVRAEDVDNEVKQWCKDKVGRYADEVGESTEHKGYVWVDRFYGSSDFSKKQMSLLLDNVIAECRDWDIEVRTPEEIAKMKGLWGDE